MDSIAKDQGKDMAAYIQQATRAANEMSNIASALAANVTPTRRSHENQPTNRRH
jgi:hypothetical protein